MYRLWGDTLDVISINIINDGYVHCKSDFYSAQDFLNNENCCLSVGINKLVGEIDSGGWAISYLLSMYKQSKKDFVLFEKPEAIVNNVIMPLEQLMTYSCYLDRSYSLFKSNNTVKSLVKKGIRANNLNISPDDIGDIFHIDKERFDRPLISVGNEKFRAMSAISYANDKKVFCFPWLSQMRFDSYHGHMTDLLDILERLEKIVILPIGI